MDGDDSGDRSTRELAEVDVADALVRRCPDDPLARKALVEALLSTGDLVRAQHHLDAVRKLAPHERWSIELEEAFATSIGDMLRSARARRAAREVDAFIAEERDDDATLVHPSHPSRPTPVSAAHLRLLNSDHKQEP